MSDAPSRVRASTAKRPRRALVNRGALLKKDAVLQAEFDAMMERSSRRLEKLNADMEELLHRLGDTRLTS